MLAAATALLRTRGGSNLADSYAHSPTPVHVTIRLTAVKNGALRATDKIKARFQPSFSLIARFVLRAILMLLICAFAPFLLLFALGHDWLMRKFINYAYIYNVSWEDPRMDQQVCPLCCAVLGMLRS